MDEDRLKVLYAGAQSPKSAAPASGVQNTSLQK